MKTALRHATPTSGVPPTALHYAWGVSRGHWHLTSVGSGPETTTLYRPVGQRELDLIAATGWCAFPPRLFHQPIFYPVMNEEYATQIARDWNTKDPVSGFVGYVLRFQVEKAFLSRYPIRTVGGTLHRELWVPSEELEEFNRHIVGHIEVAGEFRPPSGG